MISGTLKKTREGMGGRLQLTARLFAQVWRHKLGRIGLPIFILLVLIAVLAPVIAPHSPTKIDYMAISQSPSWTYWLGTDELGRDILSRLIYGAQASMHVMVLSILVAAAGGVALGLFSGYMGGWVDEICMRIVDGLLSFPTIILALAIIAALGPNLTNVVIAIAIVNLPDFARLVRGQVLSIRQLDYVAAAQAVGMSGARVVTRHIWPSARGAVVVYASLKAASAILAESALSFLGLGVQPPAPTWGGMLSTAMQYGQFWWMSVFPGLAIFLTVLSLNLIGDALRDVLDARHIK